MPLYIDYRFSQPIALDVQFEIRGFTALLGRSGAGKTSLLKALAGLLPAIGTPWHNLPPQRRPIGYLPQGSALFPHLTVLENAAFALRGPARLTQAQKLLDSLGIGHLSSRMGSNISGGEAQRAALARALAAAPELLLLDEPSAALDTATRDTVLAQLIDSIDALGIPTLAATHDAAIAALADWLVLLDGGKIIRQGTPRDCFNNPQTTAAPKLLGYQNFWSDAGKTCTIRAEDIEISSPGKAAKIIAIREQAADLRLSCTAPGPITVLIKNGEKLRFKTGQEISLYFPPEKIKTLSN